jgi:hypothetical protein
MSMLIALSLARVAGATDPFPCPVAVVPLDHAEGVAWYEHRSILPPFSDVWDGRFWTSTADLVVPFGAGVLGTGGTEGHPVGWTWKINGQVVMECGERPETIFIDDYELGHLARWTNN